jgi:hypothetical protein
MSFFMAALALGLGGLLLMALPGMRRHGRSGHARVHAHARGHAAARGGARAHGHAAAHAKADTVLRFVPEPHLLFSLLALFGAIGPVLQRTLRLPLAVSLVGAAGIAGVLEWLVVSRLWRLALRFTGEPASPLASLLMEPAEAVTPFRNGKGIVRAVLDARSVQLSAELVAEESGMPVRVGDRVTIQDVDPDRQRVWVSVR